MHSYLRYAHACAALYLAPANIPPALAAVNLRLVAMSAEVGQNPFYGPKDSVAMLVEDPEQTIVDLIVRGTVTGRNWRTDLEVNTRAYQVLAGACGAVPEVHAGFLGEWECLRDWAAKASVWVHRQDVLAKRTVRRLGMKGHSLGAAAVRVGAASIWNWCGLSLGDIITYGEPRSGLEVFANTYACWTNKATSIRIVHDDDIVPTTPPDPPYMPVGTELRLDNRGRAMTHSRNFWRRLFGLGERVRDDIDGVAVREHFMNSYIPAIELWVRDQFMKDQGMA